MKRFVISIIGLVVFCSSATAQLTDKQQIAKLNSVYEHIRDNYVDDVSLEPLVQEAIIATFKELDPHSKYLTKEEMESAKARLRGKFAGIGINYIMHNDTLVVRNTMDDSPARSSEILPNDRITAINSQSIIGLTTDSLTTLLKGEAGTSLKLRVERRGFVDPLEIDLRRNLINQSAIGAAFRFGDVGYIAIESFTRPLTANFYSAYNNLGDIKSLVIDLRDNGGGLISAAIDLTSLFLNKGDVIVSTEGRGESNTYTKRRDTKPIDIPLVVLINENSASASEIFAGAIQDHDRGTVVGHTSFGKGLVQRVIKLKDGSGIYLTIARYKTPSGRIIQRPYTMGMGEAYTSDSLRFIHPDSIPHNDRPVYKTLKLGREVYGGGGITPDEYINLSDRQISKSVLKVVEDGVIDRMAIDFIDRISFTTLLDSYPTMEHFHEQYCIDKQLLEKICCMGELSAEKLSKQDTDYLSTMFKSALAMRLYGDWGRRYIYVSEFDTMAQWAIAIANNKIME